MTAGYTMGMRPDGRELLVAVVKGTFTIPIGNRPAELAEQQADLVMADEFTDEPGFLVPKYEGDFAPFKPRCDVLLDRRPYAPGGRPVTRVNVSMRGGAISKFFTVVGKVAVNRGYLAKPIIFGRTEPSTPVPGRPVVVRLEDESFSVEKKIVLRFSKVSLRLKRVGKCFPILP